MKGSALSFSSNILLLPSSKDIWVIPRHQNMSVIIKRMDGWEARTSQRNINALSFSWNIALQDLNNMGDPTPSQHMCDCKRWMVVKDHGGIFTFFFRPLRKADSYVFCLQPPPAVASPRQLSNSKIDNTTSHKPPGSCPVGTGPKKPRGRATQYHPLKKKSMDRGTIQYAFMLFPAVSH